jgi:phosphoglycolate phosphatase
VTRLVVFDLDGTLVDSARDIAAAVNAALAALEPGTAPLPLDRVMGFVGDGARVLIERVLQHRRSPLRADIVLPLYLEAYRERLLDTTALYRGIAEALAALSARGVKLAVLTNKPGDLSRTILNALKVGPRFARIWGAGDVPARKPDPAGLRALVAELGATPAQTWLVGDSPTDVGAARAAGVRVAGVCWGFDTPALREAGPDRMLAQPQDFAELVED